MLLSCINAHRITSRIVSERQRAGKGTFPVLVVSRDSNFRKRRTQSAQHGIDLFGVFVFAARPEKPLQAIAFRARNDVHVEVRNALADSIVGSDKRALSAHTKLDCCRKQAHIRKQDRQERIRQIVDGLEMVLGDQQAMAMKQWSMVQESNGLFIFKKTKTVVGSNDFAEGAVFI